MRLASHSLGSLALTLIFATLASAEPSCPALRACPPTVDRCLTVVEARHLPKACKRQLRRACRQFTPRGDWVFEGSTSAGPFADRFSVRADGPDRLDVHQPWAPARVQVVRKAPRSFELVGDGGVPRYFYESFRLSVGAVTGGRAEASFEYELHWAVGPPPGEPSDVVETRSGTVTRLLCATTTSSTSTTTSTTSSTIPFRATLQRCDDGVDNPTFCPAQGLRPPDHVCLPMPEGDCRCHPRCGADLDACGAACPPGGDCSAAMADAAGGCVCL